VSGIRDWYNPENNYTEEAETMAFQAWSVSADPRGILQRTHDTTMPLYAAHEEVVNEFLSQGFRKIKTIVGVMPEGVDPQIRRYQRTTA